jgi:hypothetical protein
MRRGAQKILLPAPLCGLGKGLAKAEKRKKGRALRQADGKWADCDGYKSGVDNPSEVL